MFFDMVQRTPDFIDAVKKLDGHKIRVATMCSGTESPLLALGLISRAVSSVDPTAPPLHVEHVFSCEIEPFKQAYIERNFQPPLLFRDVRELGGDTATTAYGAQVPVPGDVDILIAGTSCVDYSNLNNQKQDIESKGESGETFRGMLKYVKKHHVSLVILENVCGAPWDKVVSFFDEIDYNANFVRLDTKKFYLPHTRTRVYLLATPRDSVLPDDLVEDWEVMVKDMQRKSSTPLEDYLIPSDDPRIHQARMDLARTNVSFLSLAYRICIKNTS
jgi:site-specific DNA-cytosine methylase